MSRSAIIAMTLLLVAQVTLVAVWYVGYREGWRQSETTCHPPAVQPKQPGAMGFRLETVYRGRTAGTL